MDPYSLLRNRSGDCVSYIIREITRICGESGPRAPGSGGERNAAEYMAGLLRKDCGCADVKVERFDEHPDSFYGYFYCSMACDVLCGVAVSKAAKAAGTAMYTSLTG